MLIHLLVMNIDIIDWPRVIRYPAYQVSCGMQAFWIVCWCLSPLNFCCCVECSLELGYPDDKILTLH